MKSRSGRPQRRRGEALPGVDIEILWDGMWIRRVGPYYFPDPDMFGPAEPGADRLFRRAREGRFDLLSWRKR